MKKYTAQLLRSRKAEKIEGDSSPKITGADGYQEVAPDPKLSMGSFHRHLCFTDIFAFSVLSHETFHLIYIHGMINVNRRVKRSTEKHKQTYAQESKQKDISNDPCG